MRDFVDQNLGGAIATLLSDAGHDAVHASALGMERASDPLIFERCCAEGRTLVTADKKLTKYLASAGAKCPSVVVVRDVRALRAGDLSGLLLANLTSIESVIAEHGNATNCRPGATTLTQQDVATAARSGAQAATVVIGTSRDNAEFPESASHWLHRAPRGCDNDGGREWQLASISSDWNDDIDSAEGFSQSHGVYYEHFGGATVGTPWTDASPMEDETSSIAWV